MRRTLKKHWLFVSVLTVMLTWFFYSYLTGGIVHLIASSDVQALVDFVLSFGAMAAVAFVLLVIVEVVVAPIPALLLYVVGGAIFGTFWGGVLAILGNVIGAIIAFKIARSLGQGFVERKVDKKTQKKFDNFTERYGIFALFLLRLNPLTSSDIFSYLAGLSHMSLRAMVIGTTLGLAPMVFLKTWIGYDLLKTSELIYFIFILLSFLYLVILVYGIFHLSKK